MDIGYFSEFQDRGVITCIPREGKDLTFVYLKAY